MIKNSKIAISLPKADLMRIEKVRKDMGIQRSKAIDMAIRFWLDNLERNKLIKQYEDGYKNRPESLDEIKAMEQLAAESFQEEDLK